MAVLNGGYLVRLLFISLLDLFKKDTREMNANELADELQRIHNEDIVDGVAPQLVNAIDMLRKQHAEIEALKVKAHEWYLIAMGKAQEK